MSNELINFEDKKMLETLKQTVAQGLSNEEFAVFAQFCQSTKLNPFKKEVWAIKAGGRLQIMTGINGYWAIANSHQMFDGVEQSVELDDKKNLISATCKVYRKDRKFPSVGIALMNEYAKATPIWKQMPSVMLMKCAESVALRKAFPQELNGTYTQEEMPENHGAETPVNVTPKKEEPQKLPEPPKEKVYYRIENISREQQLYLEKRGGRFDEELMLWVLDERPNHKDLPKYETDIKGNFLNQSKEAA